MWIFGYGSLIFRPSFPYEERREAWLKGWARRFWQGSTDHRGVPEAPGRVVTLVPEPGARCWGVAYRIATERVEAVLAHLDFREQGGYQRIMAQLETREPSPLEALVYVAGPSNPHYLGPASLEEIAAVVRSAHGPSGSNREYVQRLAEALAQAGEHDAHVTELARLL
ncbi:MAG: gamma-glutamylcyclotransferase [Hyalangium sp.]|uniref:gamma-glutamylcyclotransferase n=1 Tax=Hyalangium sp. TaxID=2028555 RepID=UPI00389A9D71